MERNLRLISAAETSARVIDVEGDVQIAQEHISKNPSVCQAKRRTDEASEDDSVVLIKIFSVLADLILLTVEFKCENGPRHVARVGAEDIGTLGTGNTAGLQANGGDLMRWAYDKRCASVQNGGQKGHAIEGPL